MNRSSEINNPKEELKGLFNMLRDSRLTGGLSRSFRSLAGINEAYGQSLKAIELGSLLNRGDVVHKYDDYTIYDFISSHSNFGQLLRYCHPALSAYEDYDRDNQTQLTESLYYYLLHDKKLADASEVLHVHRNTLRSRIERIQDIIQADVNDPDTAFHLLLAFKIKRLYGLLSRNNGDSEDLK